MSKLLLDLGNSQLKAAVLKEQQLGTVMQHEDLSALLDTVHETPRHIWLSSVASEEHTQALLALLNTCWGVPIQQVCVADYQHYLPTSYAVDQLGADRWLAMLACFHTCQQACLVVDCGTAITLDLVTQDGQHAGGYILPGLHLMQESLHSNTAIPWPVENTHSLPGGLAQDTGSAIQQGSQQAVAALIEKVLLQAPDNTMLFIGGGDADKMAGLLNTPYIKRQQMVIHGLAQLVTLETA